MTLLEKIIESGTANDPPPLSSVLCQCILLSDQLKVPLLRTWAEQELTGYQNPKDVPQYRVINVGAYGDFAAIGQQYRARPIPASLLEPEHRWAATVLRLTEPVSAYESLDAPDGVMHYDWPSDMIAFYQSRLLRGAVLMSAWQQVPKSVYAGVLDSVRTRVLTMAIDIKNDAEASGLDLTRIKQNSPEADKVQQTVVHAVYGNVYVAAGSQVINTQNIEVGNWDDLHKTLKRTNADGSVNVDGLLSDSKNLRFTKYGDRLEQFMGNGNWRVYSTDDQVAS
jgi:hypothetical protein